MRWLLNTLSPIPFPPWFMQLGGRLIVLMTRGRRSGRERSTALLYFDHGTKRYVVASFAGVDQHPARYLNLVAEPHVTAEVHGERTPMSLARWMRAWPPSCGHSSKAPTPASGATAAAPHGRFRSWSSSRIRTERCRSLQAEQPGHRLPTTRSAKDTP